MFAKQPLIFTAHFQADHSLYPLFIFIIQFSSVQRAILFVKSLLFAIQTREEVLCTLFLNNSILNSEKQGINPFTRNR
jgi:hypothetical protein